LRGGPRLGRAGIDGRREAQRLQCAAAHLAPDPFGLSLSKPCAAQCFDPPSMRSSIRSVLTV